MPFTALLYPCSSLLESFIGREISNNGAGGNLPRSGITYCEGDKGMPNGRLYDREGMATTGRQNLETCSVESLLVVYFRVS
jgi:hypothetical protein